MSVEKDQRISVFYLWPILPIILLYILRVFSESIAVGFFLIGFLFEPLYAVWQIIGIGLSVKKKCRLCLYINGVALIFYLVFYLQSISGDSNFHI